MPTCKICGEPLKKWYGLGGKEYMGCSDVLCNYKEEIKNQGDEIDEMFNNEMNEVKEDSEDDVWNI